MTVDDLLYYCIDSSMMTVNIYDSELGKVVWTGYGDEVPDEYLYEELSTYDVPDKDGLTINIH